MRTDRFMQGILVSDEDELFSYEKPKSSHGLATVLKRLARIKTRTKNFTYLTQHVEANSKPAVFSQETVDGDVEEAIDDMWRRFRVKPTPEDPGQDEY